MEGNDDFNSLREKYEKLEKEYEILKEKGVSANKILFNKFSALFLGKGLKKSIEKFYGESPKKENFSDVTVHIIWRLFKVQAITVIASFLPILILIIQTFQINEQLDLTTKQTNLFEKQNQLFTNQNKKIEDQNRHIFHQTELFRDQNKLFTLQNEQIILQNEYTLRQTKFQSEQTKLLSSQNSLVQSQTEKINQQNILSESSRRSSLVFLMSNILDKLDEELKIDSTRKISPELTARIIALSNSFKPYFVLEGDSLSNKKLSPERGQLLISLMGSNIEDKFFMSNILSFSNFTYADLSEASLPNKKFTFGNYANSDFSNSILRGSEFQATVLENCNFESADLKGVDFSNSFLIDVNFKNANLTGAIFDKAQLQGVILDGAIGINSKTIENIKSKNGKK